MATTFTDSEMDLLRSLVEATYRLPIGLPYSAKMYSLGQAVVDSMWAKLGGPGASDSTPEAWYCPACGTIGAHNILARHADVKPACDGVPIRTRLQNLPATSQFVTPPEETIRRPSETAFVSVMLKRVSVVLHERAALKNRSDRSGDVGCALALALDETADAISSVVAEWRQIEANR